MVALEQGIGKLPFMLPTPFGRYRPKHEPAPRDWCCGWGVPGAPNYCRLKQSKVGALPQTPPGAEPLDLNTYARFR